MPPTVVDAVLARVGTLSLAAQAALDRLAVVPSGAEVGLLRALVDDLAPVAEAERAGVVEVRGDVVAFRHELARRAVVESLPASVRLELNADVLRALLSRPDFDPFRVLHHAVAAGDDAAVITHGPAAAQEATRVGAHRQAAACYAQVLAHGRGLTTSRRAALGEAHAWALYNSNQLHAAAVAAARAAELWQQDGDDQRLVRALVTLSRQQWLTERPVAARASAERAVELARPLGDSYQNALATANLGCLLVVIDREEEGLPYLEEALGIAERSGEASVAALCHNYRGSALLQLGDLSGCDELQRGVAQATDLGDHEYVMRSYYNLIEGLWRLGKYREALGYIERAEHFGRDRDFRVHGYMFAARRCRLALMRGQWAEAEAGLRELLDGQGDPGMIGRETVPILARVLVRQGSADAPEWLALATSYAARADVLEWLVPTGLAHIEHAWLTGDHGQAGPYPELLLERTNRPGTLVQRGELLVYLRRLGYPAEPFPGCPEPYASALRGDWRSAADAWLSEGDPYERAVELAESGQVEPTLEALTVLDGLGATPAVAIVRSRLRGLGVARLPRRPQPGTLTNPAGRPIASSRYCDWSRPGYRTRKLHAGWWYRHEPWTTMSPPSCKSSACGPGARPRRGPPNSRAALQRRSDLSHLARREHSPLPCRALREHIRHEGPQRHVSTRHRRTGPAEDCAVGSRCGISRLIPRSAASWIAASRQYVEPDLARHVFALPS